MKKLALNIIKKLIKNVTILKISVGLAVAVATVITAYLFTNLLYQPKKMVKRGYKAEVTIQKLRTKTIGVTINDLPDLKGAKKVKVNIADIIKKADISKGAKTFKKCAACHTIAKGGAAKTGPNLFGIIGKKRASVAGFAYSDAMKSKSERWNYENLNQLLTKPRSYVPGTKMSFTGLKKEKDRANVIAYLEAAAKN